MEKEDQVKEAFVRKRIVVLSLGSRLFVVIATLGLHWCDFLFDEFGMLMYLMLPVTALYITVFLKFIIQNRYQRAGQQLAPAYAALGIITLLLLNAAELGVIILKSMNNSLIDNDTFFMWIALFEAGLSVFAGVYISELFTIKTRQ